MRRWHWIFLINVPIGLARHRAGDALHRGRARRDARPLRHRRHGAGRPRHRRARLRPARSLGLNFLPLGRGRRADRRRRRRSPVAYVVHARRTPAPDRSISRCSALPTFRASVVGGFLFRLGIGAMPFLLPLMLQIGFGMTPFQSGLITFATRARRDGHEDRRRRSSCGASASARC